MCSGGASKKPVIEQAITAVIGAPSSLDFQELFERQLRLRGEAVPESDKPKYWQELQAKPELRNTLIYGPQSERSQTVLRKLKPIFDLFERDWDVAVIEQDSPFSGAFRQSIYIISTGLLNLITDKELRSFAAHELAHECFIDELREADRKDCLRTYHLVEFKSDLVAVLACLLLKDDPLSIASGIAHIEAYYRNTDHSVLRENKHPTSKQRRRCVEGFLARIKRGNSAVQRYGLKGWFKPTLPRLGGAATVSFSNSCNSPRKNIHFRNGRRGRKITQQTADRPKLAFSRSYGEPAHVRMRLYIRNRRVYIVSSTTWNLTGPKQVISANSSHPSTYFKPFIKTPD